MQSTENNLLGREFARMPSDIRTALATGNEALGDLRVVEQALRAIASEDNLPDEETRRVVLGHSIALISERLNMLDEALDSLDDYLAEHLTGNDD